MPKTSQIPFAFFGSSAFSIYILEALEKAGFIPTVVVTTPDKPVGRKLVMTPTPVKEWAKTNGRNIPVFDPQKLDQSFVEQMKKMVSQSSNPEKFVFIVASYGKIIPQAVLDISPRGSLNVHPSLLPKYRGASPLQSTILNDEKETGVTIILLDSEMDHGPIVAQEKITIGEWPQYEIFEKKMGDMGGNLLAQHLEGWVSGKIEAKEQNHSIATYTKKIQKEDGLISETDIREFPYETFRKIQAYHDWPTTYFFINDKNDSSRKIRVKIATASYKNNTLTIERVIPEGKKEMSFADFKAGYSATL